MRRNEALDEGMGVSVASEGWSGGEGRRGEGGRDKREAVIAGYGRSFA